MRGEPTIGVEHGAHHFHGVAVHREMMRDEQSNKADDGSGRAPDPVAEEAFEKNAEQHGTPADEDGGGIEIRHRWPPFQIHAGDQARRMNDKSDDEQDVGVMPEPFRPDQPGNAGQDEDQNVEHHGAVKRLQLIEERFDARLPHTTWQVLPQLR